MTELEFSHLGQYNLVKQTHGNSLTDAETYATAIKPYTYSSILSIAYAERRMINLKDTRAPVAPSNIYNYAKIFVRQVATGEAFCLLIPAPIMSMFELKSVKDGFEYCVKPATGVQIAEIYSELAGESFVFAHGKLKGPNFGE